MQKVVLELQPPPFDNELLLNLLASKHTAFKPSEVQQRLKYRYSSSVNYENRNSLSLVPDRDLVPFVDTLKASIQSQLIGAAKELNVWMFRLGKHQVGCVAFGDGAFFRKHRDRVGSFTSERVLSWVYYVSRKPQPFSGGDLVFYHADHEVARVSPACGKLIIFRSDVQHEVEQVMCPSQDFADYRFTFTGFLHAQPTALGCALELARFLFYPVRKLYPVKAAARMVRHLTKRL